MTMTIAPMCFFAIFVFLVVNGQEEKVISLQSNGTTSSHTSTNASSLVEEKSIVDPAEENHDVHPDLAQEIGNIKPVRPREFERDITTLEAGRPTDLETAVGADHHPPQDKMDEEIDAKRIYPEQDHLGVHGEYENGLIEDDDFEPWMEDYLKNEEWGKYDPFYEGDGEIDEERKQHMEQKNERIREEDWDIDDENHQMNKYDFSASEGLQFHLKANTKECFYEDIKTMDDHLLGAYIVTAGEPKIDVIIRDPKKKKVYGEYAQTEAEFEVDIEELGVYEICFDNHRYSMAKMIVFATETIESQYPVRKEHVSHLSQYASHLDVKLGRLESEQRLYQLRADRHLQTEQSTNGRISWYTTVECVTYCLIALAQVIYIKRILEQPMISRSWA